MGVLDPVLKKREPTMQLSYLARTSLLLTALLVSSVTSATESWKVAGAGNSTCRDWQAAELKQKNEILSWMIGFASAVNVSYASRGLPRVQLDRLTNDYLSDEITSTCAIDGNVMVPMVDIIFKVLKDLPFK
jgi:hypothetical protein